MELQVVFTTHSPTIVDMLRHENVVLCRRKSSKRRGLEVHIAQIGKTFFEERKLSRDSYYKFHRRSNSEFLFADLVVVTESPIDAAVVEQLLSDSGETAQELGISMVALNGKENLHYMFHLLDALNIPKAFVVDRDYFLKFRDVERKKSLNSAGFPQYARELQSACVLPKMGLKPEEMKSLLDNLVDRPTAAFKELIKLGFFCFMWDLEVDLVRAETARGRFFEYLNIAEQDRTKRFLLVDRASAIKKQEALLSVVENLPAQALPTSYKSLRRELPLLAKAARAN
jgi:predicted ATP-dependent endonuclease of OLD family